jgi:acyl-homoserine lactone acylase PvdQ
MDEETPPMPDVNDPFYAHQALDRCHVITTMFDDFVATHGYVQAHPELRALAEQVGEGLGELYQALGRKTLDRP